jgi:hypothetical protein
MSDIYCIEKLGKKYHKLRCLLHFVKDNYLFLYIIKDDYSYIKSILKDTIKYQFEGDMYKVNNCMDTLIIKIGGFLDTI